MKSIKTVATMLIFVFVSVMFTGCSFFDNDIDNPSSSGNGEQNEEINVSVTITLDANGGTVNKKTLLGIAGEPLDLPIPTREGYEFYGWCVDYLLFDKDCFPDNDLTLVARWYVLEEKTVVVYDQSATNKEYIGAHYGWINWSPSAQQKSLAKAIEYFANNRIDSVHLAVSFDAYYNNSAFAISVGNRAEVRVCGSSGGDVIFQTYITNIDGYKKYTFEKDIDPLSLVPAEGKDVYMNILLDTNNSWYDMYVKNIRIEITYIEEIGTIV